MKTIKRYIVVDNSYDLDDIYCNILPNTDYFTNKKDANKRKNNMNKYYKRYWPYRKYKVVKVIITME